MDSELVERVARAVCEADIRWYSQRFPLIPADDIRKTAETDLADNYPMLARAVIPLLAEHFAKIVDDHEEEMVLRTGERRLAPRSEGNLHATAYVSAIRKAGGVDG